MELGRLCLRPQYNLHVLSPRIMPQIIFSHDLGGTNVQTLANLSKASKFYFCNLTLQCKGAPKKLTSRQWWMVLMRCFPRLPDSYTFTRSYYDKLSTYVEPIKALFLSIAVFCLFLTWDGPHGCIERNLIFFGQKWLNVYYLEDVRPTLGHTTRIFSLSKQSVNHSSLIPTCDKLTFSEINTKKVGDVKMMRPKFYTEKVLNI